MVGKMTRCLSLSPLGSAFDAFLFAPMGEDGNGMLLSVLTVLARLGIDPWLEAAELARLPEETATQRLTSFIAALPDAETVHPDPPRIAARLIALLPRVTSISASVTRNSGWRDCGQHFAKPHLYAFRQRRHCSAFNQRSVDHGKPSDISAALTNLFQMSPAQTQARHPLSGSGTSRRKCAARTRVSAKTRTATNSEML